MSDWDQFARADDEWDQFERIGSPPKKTPAPKPKATEKPSFWKEARGAEAQFYRGSGILDEAQGAINAFGNILTGKSKVDPLKAGGFVLSSMTGNVPGLAKNFDESGLRSAFETGMSEQRQIEDEYAARRPKVSNALKTTGAFAPMFVPGGQTVSAFSQANTASRAGNMARGATTAAATAGAYALADRGTPKERLDAVGKAATNPLVLGLGAGAGALAPAASFAGGRPQARTIPVEELRAGKNAAYQAVDDAGISYTPESFNGLVDDITATLAQRRMNPRRHEVTASLLDELNEMRGQSPTLTELDQFRQVVQRDAVGSMDRSERFLGRQMIREIDAFIDDASRSQLQGAGPNGAELVRAARDLNTRYRKVESVVDAAERARRRAGSTGSGGNVNNATRQELRRVWERTPNLTRDEQVAIERAVIGTPGQNALRQVGKLSPEGNGLMLAGHLAAAPATGGASAGVAALGAGAKVLADQQTQQRVQDLLRLMSNGGTQARLAAAEMERLGAQDPAIAAIYRDAATRLARASGAYGASTGARTAPQTIPAP